VDRLENLSDLYGKEARPLLFEQVARLFQSRSRATDMLGRISDERLLWVLPHTELGGARIAADRMRVAAEELELQSGRRTIHVTLSIGLSCYLEQNPLFFDSLMMQAEQALERAQNRGGNQVEEHPLPAPAPADPEAGEAPPTDSEAGGSKPDGGSA
jgi:diguanylate cyclase (GGDEF)-like protein